MSQFTYVPGDSRLVDHIIGELKSKGIFDQFRKECIADVDTRPAYQNLRLRVEGSVSGFLSRTKWRPELNKNQLRESLRKHIIEANYLEQGVERIVDQVVNPKVATVFIPQVEDLVYSYLGIQRPKCTQTTNNEYSNPNNDENQECLLPTDLEAVSLDSVKSQETLKDDKMEVSEDEKSNDKMEISLSDIKPEKDDVESPAFEPIKAKNETTDTHLSITDSISHESNDSSSKITKEKKELNEEITVELSNLSIDIPLPDERVKVEDETIEFKQSDVESSSDSTMMRNVSPLTPIRSFNNENSCDAQPPFDERKSIVENAEEKAPADNPIPISTFRFTIETEATEQVDAKPNKLVSVERSISYQYTDQINNYSGPTYDDSSSSNNLHIDYQSDKDAGTVDSKTGDTKVEAITDEQKSKDQDEKKRSHKSSHSSKDRHSSSRHGKDRRSDSKHHSSGDKRDSRGEKKPSKVDSHSKSRHSSHTDKSKDRNDRDKSKEGNEKDKSKDTVDKKEKEKSDSSKDRHSSSHKTSSNSNRDSKSKHHSSSSSRRHSSSSTKHVEEKKSSRRSEDKKYDKDHRSSSKSSRDHSRHSSSHRSEKDKPKSSSSKDKYDKENKKDDKKEKKVADDHYSASGRGNRTRRSTDRDSNDGNSSSSKGSTVITAVKTATTTADNKSSSSKSENQTSSDSTGQSDAVEQCSENITIVKESAEASKLKPVIKLDRQLKTPVEEAPKIPLVEEVPMKKPMIAANMTEAIKLMKIRKVMAAEQEKKRQEAVLLLEFQEKIHSSVSQVFSGISGPELEFACGPKDVSTNLTDKVNNVIIDSKPPAEEITEIQIPIEEKIEVLAKEENVTEDNESTAENANEVLTIIIETRDDETETICEIEETADDDYLNFMYGDPNKEIDLHYFSQQEISQAELESDAFEKFCNSLEKVDKKDTKLFLLNCDSFVEDIVKQVCQEMGNYAIVNFVRDKVPKCGPSKLNTQDLAASSEFILPGGVTISQPTVSQPMEEANSEDSMSNSSYVFSPNLSSDCSVDMTTDYEKKIDEMIMTTSRQQVMEIIMGTALPDSPSKMPKIVFGGNCVEDKQPKANLKRKNGVRDVDEAGNNNHKVLMPNKMRKISLSDQITSTTETSGGNGSGTANNFKTKLTGKARRVGLPKPKTTNTTVPMSPSSDKSVENYVQNSQNEKTSPKLNGVLAKQTSPSAKRMKFQRYDTSDLYKPKLHYMSKRHSNIT